jgi:RNase adaptor protein for sRNA GlmZ degradation
MRRKFLENKTHIREILVEREKTHPERKTVAIGLYGGMHASVSYGTILMQYDAILTA